MLKEKEVTISYLFGVIDVIITLISFFAAYYIRQPESGFTDEYTILVLLIVPVWYILLKLFNLTKFHRVKAYSVILIEYILVITLGFAIIFLAIFTLNLTTISRIVIYLFSIINLFLLFSNKILIYLVFKKYRQKGYNTRNLLIIADETADIFIQKVINNKFWGYKIKLIVSDSSKIIRKYNKHLILPGTTNISQYIELEAIDEVIYCKKINDLSEIKSLIFSCREIGVVFRMHSQLFSLVSTKAELQYFDEIPFFTFSNTASSYFSLKVKLLIDWFASLAILLLSSPMLLLIALLVKFTSQGPVFFKQKRVGLRGRLFYAYKFRTMVQNAEELKETLAAENEQDGPVFKIKNDPRITKIGKFLRKTSLDEFPQFINVLKGDMSIVGPRPAVPSEVKQYKRWQLRRLSMKPGITCIWQVSGRNEISFEEWMKLDLQYIDTWSLSLDFILILKTINVILKADGH